LPALNIGRSVSALSLRRLLHQRRRSVAVLCLVLAFGVFAHHAMPEPGMGSTGTGMSHPGGMTDHRDGMALMVMCLGVAAAAGVWALGRLPRWLPTRGARPEAREPVAWRVPRPQRVPRARAGPLNMVVLRL
jgi:hypothetical protein